MGNNSSKTNRRNDSLQSYPSFSKSDTQTSAKSSRSIRSRISSMSDNASHKSRESIHRSSAEAFAGNSNTNENADRSGTNDTQLSQYSAGLNSSNPTDSTSGYPFPQTNNANLPPSLQQWEPMEPILLYRDESGNLSSVGTPLGGPSSEGKSISTSPLTGSTHSLSVPPDAGNSTVSSGSSTLAQASEPTSVDNHAKNHSNSFGAASPSATSLSQGSYFSAPGTPVAGTSSISTPRSIPILANENSAEGVLNVDEVIQRLLDAGYSGKTTRSLCVKNSEIATICRAAREIFMSQPTLLELMTPVKIVGDVHGQYGDLIRMFDMCGFPPSANYLFLGDYVDRGKQSLETILLLLCYKIKYPENFFVLRGNHECANVTRVYGFYDECKRRCNIKTWKVFIDTFNCLPIAAVVAHKIFCVHGGLSPSLNHMNEIRNIERPTDIPDYGLLNDLVWSDPADTHNEWEDNERGVSYCYNKVAINKFLSRFGFDLVCRAHMVVEDGYEFFNDKSLVTVFSAPNYCGEFDNWGAVMSVSEDLLCTFELLKPLDSMALKQVMRKGKSERRHSMLLAEQANSNSGGPQSF